MIERVIHFLDGELNVAAACDDYISLRFTEEFDGPGEFECVLASGSEYVPKTQDLVICGGGLVYVIERVGKNTATGELRASGRGVMSLLGRRIVPFIQPYRRSVEKLVYLLVQSYATSAFPAPLEVGGIGQGADVDIVVEAGNLLDRLKRLAASVSKGLRLRYDPEYSKFVFELYDVKDRRLGNTAGNSPILLSESLGTVGAVSEVTDRSRYLNRVTVRGSAGQAGSYYIVTVKATDYDFPDGYDDSSEPLYEGYVNSGIGVSLYTSENENGESVFDVEGYFAALRERGRQQLALHRVRRTLTVTLTDGGEDADVGDVCTLYTPMSDVKTARITVKEYSVKRDRITCTATLEAIG